MSEILVEVLRGNRVESLHRGSIAVVKCSRGEYISGRGPLSLKSPCAPAQNPCRQYRSLYPALPSALNLPNRNWLCSAGQ